LNVGRNVAFGLHRGAGRAARVGELLELVGLSGLERRYPHQLSGGQQQRVALARALATDPEIVLLDEPFSSLDASLRASVRADVHSVLSGAGITAVLVTHDQDEALSMADQVAILRHGVIGQIDSPTDLYGSPRDAELAQFLGDANLVDAKVHGRTASTALGELELSGAGGAGVDGASGAGPLVAKVMIRPEQLLISAGAEGGAGERADGVVGVGGSVPGVVRSYEYFGHDAVVRVRPDDGSLPELIVRVTGGSPLRPGARVGLRAHGPVVAWPLEAQKLGE
jgi:iron(III) transport system ATP-binding protein